MKSKLQLIFKVLFLVQSLISMISAHGHGFYNFQPSYQPEVNSWPGSSSSGSCPHFQTETEIPEIPSTTVSPYCHDFITTFNHVSDLLEKQHGEAEVVENLGIDTSSVDIFAGLLSDYDFVHTRIARILTITSQVLQSEKNVTIDQFVIIAKICMPTELMLSKPVEIQPKYRSIDGRGNNKDHPDWGSTDTPFSRQGTKNYEDGIYAIKKSIVDGLDLPNPRELVQEVLLKAERSKPPAIQNNMMSILLILFLTHDMHYQVPKRLTHSSSEIGCCTMGNRQTLPTHLANSDCMPVQISKNDPFFQYGHIGCQSMVRSQLGRYTDGVETGEILNRATSYMDLSLLYGNRESELRPIRLYRDGKLRMDKYNVLPVNQDGRYLKSMNRFIASPIATLWPALFTRNHNHLAERLARLNPQWSDEIVFQEARRINIAVLQFNLITAKTIEKVFGEKVDEKYSEKRNAATSLEFAFVYRAGHYYVTSDMIFEREDGTKRGILQSDTIGKFTSTVGEHFDEALRGALNNPLNMGQFSDEIINRIKKNSKGFGFDLISNDIQRSRDQGLPSFLDIRRRCNLKPEVKTFEDFKLIFNPKNVELLQKYYKSPEDVEFYVGGILEFFEHVGNPLAGKTFGCAAGENYKNTMGGDIYFYSHPENPHPFTHGQLDAVRNYTATHLICTNSNLKTTNEKFAIVNNPIESPTVYCDNYPPMDLTAWKE